MPSRTKNVRPLIGMPKLNVKLGIRTAMYNGDKCALMAALATNVRDVTASRLALITGPGMCSTKKYKTVHANELGRRTGTLIRLTRYQMKHLTMVK